MTFKNQKGLIKNSFILQIYIVNFSFILIMKKIVTLLIVGSMFVSCKQAISEKDIAKINGYWEIENVVLADGTKKDYKINETIDFFEIKDNNGFRQKVMPQLDGTYLTNDIKEKISISTEGSTFVINYETDLAKWKEEIIEIKDSTFVVKNKQELEYHYKRAKPFSLK